MMKRLGTWAGIVGLWLATSALGGDDVPAPFAPLEHLAGGWKGTSIPRANRLKGWSEKHNWAWKFVKGSPVALTVTIDGGKVLKQGTLTFDPSEKKYHLDGTDPSGKPVAFAGTIDGEGKFLTLDRVGGTSEGRERLTIRVLPENKIRYLVWHDRQEPGAPRFSRVAETGLTREGEAFAAGGTAANLPKCILTGGAGTMTVTHAGKTYYVCCTGCRDEFEADPEVVIQKALAKGRLGDRADAPPVASSGQDDGAFEGLVGEAKPRPKAQSKSAPKSARPKAGTQADPSARPADPTARAASLLTQAQALEKSGKTEAAVAYYRRVVTEHPGTAQAKTAEGKLKALGQ